MARVDLGWVVAGDLAVGDELFTAKRGRLRVDGVEALSAATTVFNLEVAGTHTYFVGNAEAWVHNDCFDLVRKVNGIPGRAKLTTNVDEVFTHMKKFNGIDPRLASGRLHAIKAASARGGADNVIFDITGNVFSPETGELLGSLTADGAKVIR